MENIIFLARENYDIEMAAADGPICKKRVTPYVEHIVHGGIGVGCASKSGKEWSALWLKFRWVTKNQFEEGHDEIARFDSKCK